MWRVLVAIVAVWAGAREAPFWLHSGLCVLVPDFEDRRQRGFWNALIRGDVLDERREEVRAVREFWVSRTALFAPVRTEENEA